jgi:hypothetical protein
MSTQFAQEGGKRIIRSCVSGCLVDIDLVGGSGFIVFPSLAALTNSIALIRLTVARWCAEAGRKSIELSYYVSQRCVGTELIAY